MLPSSNDSFPPPHLSFINPDLVFEFHCLISEPYSFIYEALIFSRILLFLPLCIFILHHGLQLWRTRCPTCSAAAVSHTDCFTYHVAAMELISTSGFICSCCGAYMKDFYTFLVGVLLSVFTWYGEMFFHVLTCVERYLAVVHPIAYLSSKSDRWVRMRAICTGCVWLLSWGGMGLVIKVTIVSLGIGLLMSSLVIVSFCSLSVLYVLIRKSPGDHGGVRKKVSQSKRRALYTILAILGVLVMRFAWDIIWLKNSSDEIDECLLNVLMLWFNLPSSLVLPLLFLHRVGKFRCKSIG